MILRSYGPMLLVRQESEGIFTQQADDNIHSGLVANFYPPALNVTKLGDEGQTAILLAQKNYARALIFDAVGGWQVVDQFQADHPQSNLTSAASCRLQSDAITSDIVAYDSARGKLVLFSPQADGTYRTSEQIDIGSLSVKKILTGNFGGAQGASLLVCGHNKMVRVPISDQTFSLHQIGSFEPDLKAGRYGVLTVGDINNDAAPDILLCDQVGHHIQILTFNDQAQLVSGIKFKVFEQPGSQDARPMGLGVRTGSEPRAVTIGDVTGDGKNDLIVLVHDRIIIYPQE